MKRIIGVMIAVLALLTCSGMAFAGQKQDDAKALVKKAVALVKEAGDQKAIAEFNNPSGKFVKDELYIFAFDSKGLTVAHGANAKLVGKNMYDLKDSEGKFFVQDIIKKAKQGGGWTSYKWTNPSTKKIQAKDTYVEQAGDLAIGCGFYK